MPAKGANMDNYDITIPASRVYLKGVLHDGVLSLRRADELAMYHRRIIGDALDHIEQLTHELDDLRRDSVALSRAKGALADAGDVTTDDVEAGIKVLARQRDRYAAEVWGRSRGGDQ